MDELAELLPLPLDVSGQMDYNARLRIALCYFRMKMFMAAKTSIAAMETKGNADSGAGPNLQPDMVQELITEVSMGMCGCVLVCVCVCVCVCMCVCACVCVCVVCVLCVLCLWCVCDCVCATLSPSLGPRWIHDSDST